MKPIFVPHIELVSEPTGLRNQITTQSGHTWIADEPEVLGGTGTGPNPYEMMCAALAACTSMTLRMYANLKKWDLQQIAVTVEHHQVDAAGNAAAAARGISDGKVDAFTRIIRLSGNLDDDQRKRLIEIANKCPVHKTLHDGRAIVTTEVVS